MLAAAQCVIAGPPFQTDDPEPVPYRHWEVYLGTTYTHDVDSLSIDGPFAEANYGPLPNIQLSLTVPMTYQRSDFGHGAYRYGDTEVGVKWRFLSETHGRPQAAFYPTTELSSAGEKPRILLPIWLEKSFGSWTTYGGGGLRHDPNPGARDSFFAGATVIKKLHDGLSVGAEAFRETANRTNDDTIQSGFNVGMIRDLGENHGILMSLGRSFGGRNLLSFYGAYEIRFGHDARRSLRAEVRP